MPLGSVGGSSPFLAEGLVLVVGVGSPPSCFGWLVVSVRDNTGSGPGRFGGGAGLFPTNASVGCMVQFPAFPGVGSVTSVLWWSVCVRWWWCVGWCCLVA